MNLGIRGSRYREWLWFENGLGRKIVFLWEGRKERGISGFLLSEGLGCFGLVELGIMFCKVSGFLDNLSRNLGICFFEFK